MAQTILITGASRGIGLATAHLLKQQGYTVIGTYRSLVNLSDMGIEMLPMDVTQPESIKDCIETIQRKGYSIDILVNNAGYDLYGATEEVQFDEFFAQLDTNFLGAVRLIQMVLPMMRENRSGKIINISSIGGLLALPYNSAYASSKFALEGFSESLRYEMLPFGVYVSLVEPGGVQTGTLDRSLIASQTPHPAYHIQRARLMSQMQQLSSDKGIPVNQVAQTIARIVMTPRPKLRYPVGGQARFAPLLKQFLPQRWFESFMVKQFGMSAS